MFDTQLLYTAVVRAVRHVVRMQHKLQHSTPSGTFTRPSGFLFNVLNNNNNNSVPFYLDFFLQVACTVIRKVRGVKIREAATSQRSECWGPRKQALDELRCQQHGSG